MISKVIIDGTELVESLCVVILQFGCCFKITDGFTHLTQLNEALGSELSGVNVPHTRLRKTQPYVLPNIMHWWNCVHISDIIIL